MVRALLYSLEVKLLDLSKCRRLIFGGILALSLCFTRSSLGVDIEYTGNLRHIVGDVKQGQITNALDTKLKIDNVLDGFEKLGCNGIRITIFPEGENPNPENFDYLYKQAKMRGFKVFANPAQHAGAQRVANRSITDTSRVKNYPVATQVLIDRIKDFSRRYPCDWIGPFNEDGTVDGAWSRDQIDQIYRTLYQNVNGADLVGPCTWGIPAGIDMLRNSNITDYITVATTHNLGQNHDDWREFISLAKRERLPVWDSEVNTHKKFPDRPHRLNAALAANVDGLVLYHAWKDYVNLKTGELKPLGVKVRNLILKNPEELERKLATYRPQEGDILFQSIARGPFVDMIEGGHGSLYSHCGLLVKRGDQWVVLEVMETVVETPIQEWRQRGRNQSFEIYRLRNSLQKHVTALIKEAQVLLGRPYDASYEMDDSRLYGSELIYTSYKKVSGRGLGRLVKVGDLVTGDSKEIISKVVGEHSLEIEVITSHNLSKSSDLKKVYSWTDSAR